MVICRKCGREFDPEVDLPPSLRKTLRRCKECYKQTTNRSNTRWFNENTGKTRLYNKRKYFRMKHHMEPEKWNKYLAIGWKIRTAMFKYKKAIKRNDYKRMKQLEEDIRYYRKELMDIRHGYKKSESSFT